MRMRKNPNLVKKLRDYPNIAIINPKDYKGKWHQLFGNDNPIEVEFGMGRGTFITTHAKNNPNKNYIGFDLLNECVAKGLKKLVEMPTLPTNIKLVAMNLEFIEEVFEKGEIAIIYLTFSDPWPKSKHAKRRLTHHNFLNRYKNLLSAGSSIIFKTDNRPLFDFSVEEFQAHGFELTEICYDLTALNDPTNVMTEYETKFVDLGQPIHRLEAVYTGI